MKLLLTSAGFDNPLVAKQSKKMLIKGMDQVRVLFVITAAETEAQKKILPLCRDEILQLGIRDEHIEAYDFEYEMTKSLILQYDMIYVAGGSTKKLLSKIKDWKKVLDHFFLHDGLYVGVSAGSIVMSKIEDGLNYLDYNLKVHQKHHSIEDEYICLTDNQAVVILVDGMKIIGE